jgi:hypothetical protein
MRKWQAILLIYLGSVCYTIASFYHLSFGEKWSFWRAYLLALFFVSIEYVFNVIGNKNANRFISVFQIMLLIIAFDLVNLYLLNVFILKNHVDIVRDGLSLVLIAGAVALSYGTLSPQKINGPRPVEGA